MKKTFYHGTQKQHVAKIVKNGLSGQGDAMWYQLASDFETALFHSSTTEKDPKYAYVIGIELELNDNEWWEGYPTLWPPYDDNPDYSWFAIKEDIPKEAVVAVYQVPYELFREQKSLGFNRNPVDLVSASKNLHSNKVTLDDELNL